MNFGSSASECPVKKRSLWRYFWLITPSQVGPRFYFIGAVMAGAYVMATLVSNGMGWSEATTQSVSVIAAATSGYLYLVLLLFLQDTTDLKDQGSH